MSAATRTIHDQQAIAADVIGEFVRARLPIVTWTISRYGDGVRPVLEGYAADGDVTIVEHYAVTLGTQTRDPHTRSAPGRYVEAGGEIHGIHVRVWTDTEATS